MYELLLTQFKCIHASSVHFFENALYLSFVRTVIIMAWRIHNKGARGNLLLLYSVYETLKRKIWQMLFKFFTKLPKLAKDAPLWDFISWEKRPNLLRISFTKFGFIVINNSINRLTLFFSPLLHWLKTK